METNQTKLPGIEDESRDRLVGTLQTVLSDPKFMATLAGLMNRAQAYMRSIPIAFKVMRAVAAADAPITRILTCHYCNQFIGDGAEHAPSCAYRVAVEAVTDLGEAQDHDRP